MLGTQIDFASARSLEGLCCGAALARAAIAHCACASALFRRVAGGCAAVVLPERAARAAVRRARAAMLFVNVCVSVLEGVRSPLPP
eukprot:6195509-Pleurochrysis_carterae.AAC.1